MAKLPEFEKLGKMLTKEQAARVLGVTGRTLERYMDSESVPYVRLGGRVFFPAKILSIFMRNKEYEKRLEEYEKITRGIIEKIEKGDTELQCFFAEVEELSAEAEKSGIILKIIGKPKKWRADDK